MNQPTLILPSPQPTSSLPLHSSSARFLSQTHLAAPASPSPRTTSVPSTTSTVSFLPTKLHHPVPAHQPRLLKGTFEYSLPINSVLASIFGLLCRVSAARQVDSKALHRLYKEHTSNNATIESIEKAHLKLLSFTLQRKLISARYYNTRDDLVGQPVRDSPRDKVGHGTHTASTSDRDFRSSVVLGNGHIFKGTAINFSNLIESNMYPLVFLGNIAAPPTPWSEEAREYY